MLVTQYCSMAGPVYDPQKKTLDLCSLVRVYDNIGPWMNELISMASVLQIGEAKYWASEVAKASKAHPATSGHFENGERSSPDEMAEIIETLIVPMGQEPSKWLGDEFKDVVDKYMQRPPSIGATAGSSGCAVEFPYGEESSSLCQLMADVAHPRYGNGLFLHQSFPVDKMGEIEGIDLALSLNHEELTIKPSGYGFGSYVFRDKMINFVTFLPNIAFTPGLLPSLYYSCAGRARYISNKLSKIGWGSESYDVGRSSVMSRQLKEFRFGTKATGSAVVSSD